MGFPIRLFSGCPWLASISQSFHNHIINRVSTVNSTSVDWLKYETRNFTECVDLSQKAYNELKSISYSDGGTMRFSEVVASTIPINTFLLYVPSLLCHFKLFKNMRKSVQYFYLAATFAIFTTLSMFTESRSTWITAVVFCSLFFLAFLFNSRRCFEVADKPPLQNTRGQCEFVTFSRTAYLFVTAIAILAIDFSWMPRNRKKSDFGYTLMDTGVGCATFFAGLSTNWGAKRLNWKKVLPIFCLSVLRFFVHSNLGLLTNPTEYGVHWNFFSTLFTIFAVSIVFESAFPILTSRQMMIISASLGVFYEILLVNGLADYILTAPRIDFISKNKEGIFGSVGYFAVYFFGVSVGQILRQFRTKSRTYLLKNLLIHTILIYGAEIIYSIFSRFDCSRRLTNLRFILLSLAFNMSILIAVLVGEIIRDSYFENSLLTKSGWLSPKFLDSWVPKTDEWNIAASDLSSHLLFVFLQANVQTGLVGILVRTLQSSLVTSTALLFLHSFALFALPAYGRLKKEIEKREIGKGEIGKREIEIREIEISSKNIVGCGESIKVLRSVSF
eukprot:GHVP01005319.1.p1 GENE.GHVP01005319.1~~GHVP01005319.1.p1  ORF type:complete len:571 (+),score=52.13 GHVP01005319.1:41-1714(+)